MKTNFKDLNEEDFSWLSSVIEGEEPDVKNNLDGAILSVYLLRKLDESFKKRLTGVFELNELNLIVDCMNGKMIEVEQVLNYPFSWIIDHLNDCSHQLFKKWDVSKNNLYEKLSSLSEFETLWLLKIIESDYWHNHVSIFLEEPILNRIAIQSDKTKLSTNQKN